MNNGHNSQRQKIKWWFPGAGANGGENRELVFNIRVSDGEDEKVLETDGVGHTQCEYTQCHGIIHLIRVILYCVYFTTVKYFL